MENREKDRISRKTCFTDGRQNTTMEGVTRGMTADKEVIIGFTGGTGWTQRILKRLAAM